MSYSSVTLFYGQWVKTWSLAFAADAHTAVQPILPAIDRIVSVAGEGAIVAEEGNSTRKVVDLPAGVWETAELKTVYMVSQRDFGRAER